MTANYNTYILDLLYLVAQGNKEALTEYDSITLETLLSKLDPTPELLDQLALIKTPQADTVLAACYYIAKDYQKASAIILSWAAQGNQSPVKNTLIAKNIKAMCLLVDMYIVHDLQVITPQQAFILINRLVELGVSRMETGLALFYYRGFGAEQNYKKAFDIAKNIKPDDPVVLHLMAMMYLNGQGVKKNYQKAFELANKLLDAGHNALSILDHLHGKNFLDAKVLYAHAINYHKKLIQAGDVTSMYLLAMAYFGGYGTAVDQPAAIHYATMASEQGHVFASAFLSYIYFAGCSVKVDKLKAFEYAARAAQLHGENEVVPEMIAVYGMLAECYYHGEIVPKDEEKAFKMATLAHNSTNPEGVFILMRIHFDRKTPHDYKKAFELAKLALKFDYQEADVWLGQMYLYGLGTKKNQPLGLTILKKASEDGDEHADKILHEFHHRSKV